MPKPSTVQKKDSEYHLSEWAESGQEQYLQPFLSPLHIEEGSSFVDVGCGSGYISAYLASRVRLRHNIGLDLDFDTVQLARRLNAEVNSVNWVCASAESVPLPSGFADTVVCRGVIPLAKVGAVVAETSRILRPGGKVVFLVHAWSYYLGWISLHPRKWKRSLAGLLHFSLGTWWNLTGHQLRIRRGTHYLGQTYQTEFRMRRLLRQYGMELQKSVRKREFLMYARKRQV
jgi:SAM-dependent methyltransferase